MKEIFDIFKICLFHGLNENEIESILKKLSARKKQYKKGEYIFHSGDKITNAGIIMSGEVHICREDYWGNLNILNKIGVNGIFGESYALGINTNTANNALAVRDSEIILLNFKNIFNLQSDEKNSDRKISACDIKFIENLTELLSEKNQTLARKNGYLSQRSIREKILSYLSDEATHKKSSSFEIPFNRQEMADFLSADRSALSAELSKMRNEGLIDFNKNKFKLL